MAHFRRKDSILEENFQIILPAQMPASGLREAEGVRLMVLEMVDQAVGIIQAGPPKPTTYYGTRNYSKYAAAGYADAMNSYIETGEWFFEESADRIFSFTWCCSLLGIDQRCIIRRIDMYRPQWEKAKKRRKCRRGYTITPVTNRRARLARQVDSG